MRGLKMALMKQEIRHPEKRAHTGSYSAGVLMDGWLFISGQGPLDMATGKVIGDDIETQTRITMEHIGKILAQAGATFDDVVKCTCHLASISDFDGFDRVYAGFFPGIRPARTTVESGLAGILVEIDAIARAPR
jgi:2-iminobutanoate/2-iminopropanoate deaminase